MKYKITINVHSNEVEVTLDYDNQQFALRSEIGNANDELLAQIILQSVFRKLSELRGK